MCKYLLEQNETQLDKISCTQHYHQEACTQFTLTPREHSSKYGNEKKLIVIVYIVFFLSKRDPTKMVNLWMHNKTKREK
jgi:hypothetical protein